MQHNLVKALFPSWVYWLAFFFSVAGLLYSIGKNMPWLAFWIMLPLLVTSLERAYHFRSEQVKVLDELNAERRCRADAESKLQQLSAAKLIELESMLAKSSIESAFDLIEEATDYLSRLQEYEHADCEVRNIVPMGADVYVAARITPKAFACLRTDDPFVLTMKKDSLMHHVAMLQVHQLIASWPTQALSSEPVRACLCRLHPHIGDGCGSPAFRSFLLHRRRRSLLPNLVRPL